MSDLLVVIPAKDAASTLSAALASVCGQTLQPDRVLVVDDGSSDGTAEVAESFGGQLPVEVFRHPTPRGVGAAMRTALEGRAAARFARLDADDVWLPDHLETLAAGHRSGEVISADALLWSPGQAIGGLSWFGRYPLPAPQDQLSTLVRRNIVLSSTLIEVGLYWSHGGYGDLESVEDWDFWLRLASARVTFRVASHPTMLYRQSAGTRSKGATAARTTSAMLERYAATASSETLAAVARSTARDWGARAALYDAQAAARDGRSWSARRHAVLAVYRGSSRTRIRAAATALAPSPSTKLYDRLVERSQGATE